MNTGTPILGLLGIAFIVLKLTGYVTWSWLWVLAPFWGGFVLVGVFLVFALFFAAAAKLMTR